MKVAVIEDDPEVFEIVSIAFETAWPGSEVVSAPNGTEGLELVRKESTHSEYLLPESRLSAKSCFSSLSWLLANIPKFK